MHDKEYATVLPSGHYSEEEDTIDIDITVLPEKHKGTPATDISLSHQSSRDGAGSPQQKTTALGCGKAWE